MYLLGISCYYHDSAACIIKDGEILSAVQEESLTRIKHDSSFPMNAIDFCIRQAAISPAEIDCIVYYEKPFIKFERLLETYFAVAPKGYSNLRNSIPSWVKDKVFLKIKLLESLKKIFKDSRKLESRLLFSEHHLSHAASAYYPSPYDRAAVLILDGVGEDTTTSCGVGNGSSLDILKEIKFPHSLGLLYSAFTYYTGFKVNSGEYKMMGLAPYGDPRYIDIIKDNLINISEDGSFWMDMSYFNYLEALTMTSDKFEKLFKAPPRMPEDKITQRDMDLAASIQKVLEEIILKICKSLVKETGEKNLCLAGGVALNCVANGVLLKNKIFDSIWIQPAAGDAGGAVGAALSAYYLHYGNERIVSKNQDGMKGSFLGPAFTNDQVGCDLDKSGAKYAKYE